MVLSWNVAILAAPFSTDPRISLMNYIRNSYTITSPALTTVHIDTKFTSKAQLNHIIIEKMPDVIEVQTLGKSRVRHTDHYRIQIYCKGFSSINNAWLIKEHLESILGANPTGMRSDGIDEIQLDRFELINTDDDTLDSDKAKSTLTTRYVASIALVYDKVAA